MPTRTNSFLVEISGPNFDLKKFTVIFSRYVIRNQKPKEVHSGSSFYRFNSTLKCDLYNQNSIAQQTELKEKQTKLNKNKITLAC